ATVAGIGSGGTGSVTSDLPIGAGLSSSSSLTVAVAIALGLPAGRGHATTSAAQCQRAEQVASGVPGGIMDQLTSLAGISGHALLIDCSTLALTPVPIPPEIDVVVAHSGEARRLSSSPYAARRQSVDRVAALIGPLRQARLDDVMALEDDHLRRVGRHVVTENARVLDFAAALAEGDLALAGSLLDEGHASLRDDFEASSPGLEALVAYLRAIPGVYGARLTGAGWGGCAVALADRGAVDTDSVPIRCWIVKPSEGARLL
ncbi:MAG TPA: hypothetical protein VGS21_11365, partial [Acidimicrobiales bacterium]|nr:hypothetical protein [Acidimicrobiales bacterium]